MRVSLQTSKFHNVVFCAGSYQRSLGRKVDATCLFSCPGTLRAPWTLANHHVWAQFPLLHALAQVNPYPTLRLTGPAFGSNFCCDAHGTICFSQILPLSSYNISSPFTTSRLVILCATGETDFCLAWLTVAETRVDEEIG